MAQKQELPKGKQSSSKRQSAARKAAAKRAAAKRISAAERAAAARAAAARAAAAARPVAKRAGGTRAFEKSDRFKRIVEQAIAEIQLSEEEAAAHLQRVKRRAVLRRIFRDVKLDEPLDLIKIIQVEPSMEREVLEKELENDTRGFTTALHELDAVEVTYKGQFPKAIAIPTDVDFVNITLDLESIEDDQGLSVEELSIGYRSLEEEQTKIIMELLDSEAEDNGADDSISLGLEHYLAPDLLKDLDSIHEEQTEDRRSIKEFLVALSAGIDPDQLPLNRYIPARIYLKDGENSDEVVSAVFQLLDAIDFSVDGYYEPREGSFFQKLYGKSNEKILNEEVINRLKKIERAAELEKINKTQSQIDMNLAEAVARLNESLKDEDEAAIQLSSLIYVKQRGSNGKPQVRTRILTQQQLIYLEQNPQILESPDNVINSLDSIEEKPKLVGNKKPGS